MRRFFIAAATVCLCAATASAQTKITGTAECAQPDPQHVVPAGDRANHSLGVDQVKCTYTKPLEIEGDKSKEGVSTETLDISGNSSRARGVHIITMETGDKCFLSYQGTTTTKDGALVAGKGSWAFTGGTGKMKGIKGKGTYNCTPAGGGVSCAVEGEYTIAK